MAGFQGELKCGSWPGHLHACADQAAGTTLPIAKLNARALDVLSPNYFLDTITMDIREAAVDAIVPER
jgi:hypothetical protein